MKVISITQPLKEYGINQTNVYVRQYDDQEILINWCEENFGKYILAYSKIELDEPIHSTVFIFENIEQAMAFKLRWE